MKYVAIIDDAMLNNFRVDRSVIGIKPLVMVVNDESGTSRGIQLTPLVAKATIISADGMCAYLSKEHIDCLVEFEGKMKMQEAICDMMNNLGVFEKENKNGMD